MSIIAIEIVFIFFLTAINGLFAMSEIALLSARKARLQQWAERGDKNARLALETSHQPEDFLSTVQVGITLIGVFAGAFGGATLAQHLAVAISKTPWLSFYAETIAVGLVVIAITYLSLIIGELVPKRLALNHPERIATLIVRPMRLLSRLASPLVRILSASTNTILWLFRVRSKPESPVTEEEIRILLKQGTEAGLIEPGKQDIVDRVFRLGARRASTLMIPRKSLTVLYTGDSPDEIQKKIVKSGQGVFPLCEETMDNVLGIVRTQDMLTQTLAGKRIHLKEIVRQPLFLPESVLSTKLLEDFREKGEDTALLLDEYGVVKGFITASSVLKALLGELSSLGTPKASKQPDGTWLIDGMLPLDEFKEALKIHEVPDEEALSVVAGLMLVLFNRVPTEGEMITWDRFTFKIIDMDGNRIDKVLVTPLERKQE